MNTDRMTGRTRHSTSRRTTMIAVSLVALTTAGAAALVPRPVPAPAVSPDEKELVMQVGMTEAEAECWLLAAELAGRFFELPELHPMDSQEVATAIHVIQNKLLSRPTYRDYLDLPR